MIQCYVARDNLGEEAYKEFKKLDIGDIVGVKGTVFKTKTGEISIHVTELTLLSKSLQILPEKFHGLTNTDLRQYPELSEQPGLHGGGDSHAGGQCRRRRGASF